MVKHSSAAILAGIVALVFAAAPVSADNQGWATDRIHKLDKQLRESVQKAPKPERVIIRMKDGHGNALKQALRAHGDVVAAEHPEVGAMTAIVHGEDLVALANDPAVESVSVDAIVRGDWGGADAFKKTSSKSKAVTAVKNAKSQKSIATAKSSRIVPRHTTRASNRSTPRPTRQPIRTGDIRKLQGLDRYAPTGRGIGVAVIDSGIQLSQDLSGRVTAFVDFTQGPDPVWATPYDDYGHGTFIASQIAGMGQDDAKYQGMAPYAHLIGLKVLDKSGSGRASDVIRAIEFAIEYKDVLDIDVINLSLGHPIFESAATDPLVIAVEAAHRAGLVVVASAGNFGMNPQTHQVGYGGITSPGDAPSAITVGAVDQKGTLTRDDDYVASFSSRGPTWVDGFAKPDLVAPGVGEVAQAAYGASLFKSDPALLFDDNAHLDARRFAKLSGTSMAAAEVSGIVALVLEANPALPANAVKAILEYSATPLADKTGEPYDALTQGAGEANAAGAIVLARAIQTSPGYADGWVVGAVEPSTVFDKKPYLWSQNIVWGNYFVNASPAAMFANGAPYDDNIVWGAIGRSDDDNIVWGNFVRGDDDNIVWGNLAVWGSLYDDRQSDNIVWGNFARGIDENIVWGNFNRDGDNIVWGNFYRGDDNIVWGNVSRDGDNIVWGNNFTWDDNIVWGNSLVGTRGGDDNIVWGNLVGFDGDNIVWGNLTDDNIVWGNFYRGDAGDGDNIVWGNSVVWF